MPDTRSIAKIPLLGPMIDSFGGQTLPTSLEVLKLYFFHRTINGVSQRDAIKLVCREVHELWKKSDIPTCTVTNIVRRLQNYLAKYRNLRRNSTRRTPFQIRKEKAFVKSLECLYDISRVDALNTMKNDCDKEFLIDQRSTRKRKLPDLEKEHQKLKSKELEKLKKYRKNSERFL